MIGRGSRNTRRIATFVTVLAWMISSPPVQAEEEFWTDAFPVVADGRAYSVSGIVPFYAEYHPDHPNLGSVLADELELGRVTDGFVAPRPGVPRVKLRLAELAEGRPGIYYASALAAVNQGLLTALNRRGLGGVAVQTNPDEIDPETGEDQRPDGEGAVTVAVHTGRISDLRVVEIETFCFGDRCDPNQVAGSPLHERIKAGSPIQPTGSVGPGQTDLLRLDRLEDYVALVNRHPGRRAVAEISPSRINPGSAYVDFKIVEDRPWSFYTQGSDTGTRSTQHWRQRSGFRHTQLSGRDDVLRIDWVSNGRLDDDVRGGFVSYEVPIGFGEIKRLRLNINGGFADYDASDIGFTNSNFTGRSHTVGSDLIYNVFQYRELFVDLLAGGRWTDVRVDNQAVNQEGSEDYWLARGGVRISRDTDASRLLADVALERSLGGGSALSELELEKLGRLDVDDRWQNIRYNGRFGAFLDPLLGGLAPFLFDTNRRGHELLIEVQGQYSRNRLIPQEERISGGLYSVRGYDQALLAGDNVFIARNEYVLHIPRLLPVHHQAMQLPVVGDFKVTPQHAAGRPDWDLTLSLFIDLGVVSQNDRKSYEAEQSLWGYGAGVGLQLMRNLSLQYYYALAGRDVKDPLGVASDFAERGDANHHIEFTLAY